MTLRLRIDNFDTLEDGGPTWIALDQRGASVGRGASMDWILPDPAKHISTHHFEIQFHDGAYWLRDMSMNGTYIEGQHHRLDGVVRLQGGERLVVGHYVIAVDLGPNSARRSSAIPQSGTSDAWGALPEDADPWDLSLEPLQPVNPLPAPAADPHRLDDLAQEFVPLQQPDRSPTSDGPAPLQQPPVAAMPRPTVVVPPPARRTGAQAPMPERAAPTPDTAANPSGDGDFVQMLESFCRGAGIPPEMARNVDPVVLMEAIGRSTRMTVQEIMGMLKDRKDIKLYIRGGERTMRSATGNNPMKFMPDVEKAFEALFLRPQDGFMTAPEGFENALEDLRKHQAAVFAALQPALAEVLKGLSPEEIEDSGAGTILAGSKSKRNWEAFVQRWDEKASAGDHGMLDAFVKAFAKAYAEVTGKSG